MSILKDPKPRVLHEWEEKQYGSQFRIISDGTYLEAQKFDVLKKEWNWIEDFEMGEAICSLALELEKLKATA